MQAKNLTTFTNTVCIFLYPIFFVKIATWSGYTKLTKYLTKKNWFANSLFSLFLVKQLFYNI